MMKQAILASAAMLSLTAATVFAADEAFVMKVAKGGTAEVELGRLTTEKASSDAVKRFGQRMVDDHSKANDELKALARSKNVTLSTAMGPEEQALRDRLMKLSGPAFDQAYMSAMVSDHAKVVNEFRMESKNGSDPDVKAWAAKTLPTIEEHLKMARDASGAVGTSASR